VGCGLLVIALLVLPACRGQCLADVFFFGSAAGCHPLHVGAAIGQSPGSGLLQKRRRSPAPLLS